MRNILEAVVVDAIGLDWTVELGFARDQVQARWPVQGISIRWRSSPEARRSTAPIDAILEALRRGPVHFQSRPRHPAGNADCHVQRLIERVRKGVAEAHERGRGRRTPCTSGSKAFHIIAVIAWIAGMLYLPRLFVYHCAAEKGSVQSETLKVVVCWLLRAIIVRP